MNDFSLPLQCKVDTLQYCIKLSQVDVLVFMHQSKPACIFHRNTTPGGGALRNLHLLTVTSCPLILQSPFTGSSCVTILKMSSIIWARRGSCASSSHPVVTVFTLCFTKGRHWAQILSGWDDIFVSWSPLFGMAKGTCWHALADIPLEFEQEQDILQVYFLK